MKANEVWSCPFHLEQTDLTAFKITIKCFIQKVLRPRNHGNIGQFIICPLARLSGSIHFFFPMLSLQPAKIFFSFRSSFVANWRRWPWRIDQRVFFYHAYISKLFCNFPYIWLLELMMFTKYSILLGIATSYFKWHLWKRRCMATHRT